MKFLSLKWKIAFAMAGLSVLVVILYVMLAKNTFEQDKISYVYDTQQTQADLLSSSISQRIERVVLQSQLLTSQYLRDNQVPELSSGVDANFELLVYDVEQAKVLFHSAKSAKRMSAPSIWPRLDANKKISIIVRDSQNWDVISLLRDASNRTNLYVMSPVQLGSDFSSLRDTQNVVLATDSELAPVRFEAPAFESIKNNLLAHSSGQTLATTFELSGTGDEQLVSLAFLTIKPYRILILSRTQEALQALQLLFKRSVFFIIFSVGLIFGLSFLLSRQLTSALSMLTSNTERVGEGDFTQGDQVRSNDEIGQLAGAFEIMKRKILELLDKTKETARMEQELKTTKLVQESLFPKKSVFRFNTFAISGYFQTSTECGGDWWYYFTSGDDLYIAIADATGHGTPAALITATARSCFSFFEKNPTSLPNMMNEWSDAVMACSNQRVFMTGMIFKFNSKTGAYEYLNASHEPPFHFRNDKNLFYAEPIPVDSNKTLGETMKIDWKVMSGQLGSTEKMMIFTDGLFAITDKAGSLLSEKRAITQIQKIADSAQSLEQFAAKSMEIFEKHRQGTLLPDDVTAIFVQRETST
ncbi:MAG: PP2C family protein-serine/threonine phosphatase [Bdellovibrio sp.]